MLRRQFLSKSKLTLIGLQFPFLGACPPKGIIHMEGEIDILEITIQDIQEMLAKRQILIVDLVRIYIDRIEAIDKHGVSLNSIIQINFDAMDTAKELDVELRQGKSRGPMHGIPVVLKDNIDTKEMFTTAGSKALAGSLPLDDAWITDALRKSGAIILAKANLSEWANFRGEPSTSGWSGLGGLTKNPYKLDRNTCGSSAGSAAAVSANLCTIAIGTETNGSIVCPSQTCGIVGIKPTVGLVSRDGIIPISYSQDTAGPMARTVRDAAICLSVITGVDSKDQKTREASGKHGIDYATFLNPQGLQGKRIGVHHSAKGRHPRVDKQFMRAISDMEHAGATIIELDQVIESEARSNSFNVMLYEYKDGLEKYFTSLGPNAKIKNLEELIAFNTKDDIELSFYDQTYLEQALAKGSLESKEYLKALKTMHAASRENGIDLVMDKHQLDAIISPAGSPAWKTDLTNGDNFSLGSSSPAAISGYPNITVPMGFIDDLPVGISIYGRAWSESILIEIAYAYEQKTKHRRVPLFMEK